MIGWLKWAGVFLTGITILWGGTWIASVYKKRVLFWEQMAGLCRTFENEFRYTADTPERIFERFCWDEGLLGSNHLQYATWKYDFENLQKTLRLKGEHTRQINGFFAGLGTTDLEGQLAHCAVFSQVFWELRNHAQEQYRSKGQLTRTLSVLLVAAVTIFAI